MTPDHVGAGAPRTLILLRHGHSRANAEDAFSGWLDVALSERGEREATRAAELLVAHDLRPSVVHTSVLSRAVRTAEVVLECLGRPETPTRHTWRLNERHYGALQGRSRAEVRVELGEARFRQLRRSYLTRPPELAGRALSAQQRDPLYRQLPPDALPRAETLADVRLRVVAYWQDAVATDVAAGRTPLVVAHGNSIRALCMHLDDLDAAQIMTLDIPTGIPLRYDLDRQLRPIIPGGTYLDPLAAAAGAAEVAAAGRQIRRC